MKVGFVEFSNTSTASPISAGVWHPKLTSDSEEIFEKWIKLIFVDMLSIWKDPDKSRRYDLYYDHIVWHIILMKIDVHKISIFKYRTSSRYWIRIMISFLSDLMIPHPEIWRDEEINICINKVYIYMSRTIPSIRKQRVKSKHCEFSQNYKHHKAETMFLQYDAVFCLDFFLPCWPSWHP